jgi:NADPH-dependent 2,4-dienoyl-CoA reductase/sulfur reductase-like enzyme
VPRERRVIVVGASLAGLRAVESLRREGYDGQLTLIGEEEELPYDRPPLSKDVLAGTSTPESTTFRTADHFEKLEVELELGAPATGLDLATKELLVGRRRISFESLVIATGASPRRLPALDGLENIFVLRTLADARKLREALVASERLVVIGAGVIGCEVAATARGHGLDVTIVETASTAMIRSVGPELGAYCAEIHREHGTAIRCSVVVEAVENGHGASRLRLSDGWTLETDIVVVGIGVVPNESWLSGSGIQLENGVICDATLNAGHPAVRAAGDVANWPNPLFGERMRSEQWTNAVEQGRHVARAVARGESAPFVGSNYFWSDQYGHRIQFVGSPIAEEVVVVEGDVESRRFLAWYRRGERLVGAFTIGLPKLLMESKLLVERRASWQEAVKGLAA